MYSSNSLLSGYIAAVQTYIVIILIVTIVFYILVAIGLSTMAKNKGLDNPWLAWIPIGNYYLLGEIIDDKIAFGSFIIPHVKIILPIASLILAFFSYAVGSSTLTWLIYIAYMIFDLAVFYRLYKLYKPESAGAYLVLSIFFSMLAIPICTYIIRNNEPHEYLPGQTSTAYRPQYQSFQAQQQTNAQQNLNQNSVVCPNCGSVMASGNRFCKNCGAPSPTAGNANSPGQASTTPDFHICPQCGEKNAGAAMFCKNCGSQLK